MPDPLVRFENVRLIAGGEDRLRNLTFALTGAGVTALMGPNGAGKSLTLRLIASLEEPTEGVVRFDEGPASSRISLVFQKPVLLRRSVHANLAHALAIYGEPRRLRTARVAELLDLCRLSALSDAPARRLSGGEQQRLAMVRALAARPRLLLLDEPTASLDPQSTAMIEALIRHAVADGAHVLLVTHDQGQARRLADDVLFLHGGHLTEHRPAEDFFDRPDSEAAKAYLGGRLLV